MVRPFGIKEKKRKKREERYDREEEEKELIESVKRAAIEDALDAEDDGDKVEEEDKAGQHDLEGILIALSDQNTNKREVVFVLERACLEVAKVGKNYQILNSEDHAKNQT